MSESSSEFSRTASRPASASTADDAALVRAALAGEAYAFDAIVERHRRAVYQVCFRFVGNQEDANDLAQDTFVRAYRALAKFRQESSLATWLYRIAVNVCLNSLAVKRPTLEPLAPERHVDTIGDRPDDPLHREEQARLVKAAVARLPPKQRATLVLRVYHELPHDRIAEILGSSVGAVKANFFHALNNLRRLLIEGKG